MTDVCKIIIHWLNLIIMKKSKKMPQILFLRSFWRMRSPSQARRSRNAQNELLGRREFGTWWWAHLSYNMVNLSFGLLLWQQTREFSSRQDRIRLEASTLLLCTEPTSHIKVCIYKNMLALSLKRATRTLLDGSGTKIKVKGKSIGEDLHNVMWLSKYIWSKKIA